MDLPRDAASFVRSWRSIYRGDPHWVAPLVFERKAFLDPSRNPYFRHADVQCFMAYADGRPVGTISAQVDHAYQQSDPGVGFFGFFEMIEDEDVARALWGAAVDWLRDQGMTRAIGPFSFNTNHEFALLIDGFDTDPCVLNPHARPYYGGLYEALGLRKERDWYAYWFDVRAIPERIARLSDRLLERHPEVTIRHVDMSRFDTELGWFWKIYNDAWEQNWAHVPLGEEEFTSFARGLRAIIDPTLVWFAFVDGEPAAASVTLPDVNQVVKKMDGRLFPTGWFHWKFGRGNIDVWRVLVLGVRRRFQHLPLGAPLYLRTWEQALARGIRGADASLVVEDNHKMRGAIEKLGGRIYKTYRVYSARLS